MIGKTIKFGWRGFWIGGSRVRLGYWQKIAWPVVFCGYAIEDRLGYKEFRVWFWRFQFAVRLWRANG